MDFRELSYVIAIAKYQNITKAAEALYMAQPNLSKFLSTLENELGLKLFERSDNKYFPTYAGKRYLEYARNILESKAGLDSELADIIKRDIGVLNIGLPNMRCAFMLPKTLPAFNQRYPNVVNIYEGTSAMIDNRLLDGDIDLAFYSKPYKSNPHIDYEILAPEELFVCTCKDHPVKNLADSQNRIELSALKNERLILLSPEQRTGQISRHYLQKNNISLANSITTNNMPAVISLTEQGWGVSFVFGSHLRWHLPVPDIETFSFGPADNPRVMSNFVAAFRKGSYLSTYAREFIKLAGKLYK